MTVISPYIVLSQGQHLTLCSLKLGCISQILFFFWSVTVLLGPRNCGLLWDSGWQGERRDQLPAFLLFLAMSQSIVSSLQHQPLVSNSSFLPTLRTKAHQSLPYRNSLMLSPLWFQITLHDLLTYLEVNPFPFCLYSCRVCRV